MKKILALSLLFISSSIFSMQQPPKPEFKVLTKECVAEMKRNTLVFNVAITPFVLLLPPSISAPVLITQYAHYKSLEAMESALESIEKK